VSDGKAFKIQVKGISYSSGIWVQKAFFDAERQPDLFLVIVLVPLDDVSPLRFFVLSHDEAKHEFSIMPKIKKDGNPVDSWGLNWSSITPYEIAWTKLPALKA